MLIMISSSKVQLAYYPRRCSVRITSVPREGPEVSLPYIFDIFIPKMGEALNIDREVVD